MRTKKPITKVMSASQVRQHFAETVNEVARGNTRIVVEKNGAPAGAFVSARDLERLEFEDAKWEEDSKFLEEIRSRFADVDPEEIERMALETTADARADIRREREKREQNAGRVA
ncbi:hypothetical protein BH09CHL1_BH09CHL1_28930 [soil metagenome]